MWGRVRDNLLARLLLPAAAGSDQIFLQPGHGNQRQSRVVSGIHGLDDVVNQSVFEGLEFGHDAVRRLLWSIAWLTARRALGALTAHQGKQAVGGLPFTDDRSCQLESFPSFLGGPFENPELDVVDVRP